MELSRLLKLPELLEKKSFFLFGSRANGEKLNLTSLGNDCQVAPSTIREYLNILEDTLVGFMLPGTEHLERNSNLYGKAFEQFIAMELRAWLSYGRSRGELSYWRSTSKQEVDFVIGEALAVEVKASAKVGSSDFRGLRALQEEGMVKRLILVSQDPIAREKDGLSAMHWKEFLAALWEGRLLQ